MKTHPFCELRGHTYKRFAWGRDFQVRSEPLGGGHKNIAVYLECNLCTKEIIYLRTIHVEGQTTKYVNPYFSLMVHEDGEEYSLSTREDSQATQIRTTVGKLHDQPRR